VSDAVLDLIDGSIAAYGDAMRWTPDPPPPASGPFDYAAMFDACTEGRVVITPWQEALLEYSPTTIVASGFRDPFTRITLTPVQDAAVYFEHLGHTIRGTTGSLGVFFDEVKRFLAADVAAAHRARLAASRRARLSRMRTMYRARHR
jgi:hypothetical protein